MNVHIVNAQGVNLRAYSIVAVTELKDQLAQPAALVGRSFFLAIILWVFFHLWTTIYAGRTVVEGFTLSQILWYTAFSEAIVFSLSTQFIETIGEEVRTGTIAASLTKPLWYPAVAASRLVGSAAIHFFIFGTVSVAITAFLVGLPPFGILHIPLVFLTFLGGLCLNAFIVLTLGLSAFWFEDVTALYWMYHKSTFVLGGMLAPIEMYPLWLKSILNYLPFVYTTYGPTKLLVHFSANGFISVIAGQVFWTILAAICLFIIYDAGIKKVYSNGG